MYKVIIRRTVPPAKEKELNELITKLRVAVLGQSGYISGETLKNTENPDDYLVISIWDKAADWKSWLESDDKKKIQSEIDKLLGKATSYETYEYPHISIPG